jgi:DNA (cytosine-5)-methyltransferase 1
MHGEAQPKKRTRKAAKIINAVDLFCGAGGTSSGLIHAVNDLGYEIKLTAINHWDVAIATHSKNHEDVEHHCQSIDTLDPLKVIPHGRLQLLVASPECIHHSNARGGKPRSDQKRADAWMLMRWIDKLYVENILIENVPEFRDWGPLTAKGKPDKRHKGEYFKQFIAALSINYRVEYRILNCADYGDPTTRKRLFIMARRGFKKIVWPVRTHASRKELAKFAADPESFGVEAENMKGLEPWVSAKEIIDWSLEGKSVFGRKTPLKPNTMRRILKGLEKYSLAPFLVPQRTEPATRDVDEPLGTVTTTSRGIGIAEPEAFVIGQQSGSVPRDVEEPLPTVAAKGAIGLVDPYLINLKNRDRRDREISEPTFTQAAGGNHQAVAEPFIVSAAHGGNTNPARSIEEPLGAVLGSGKFAIVEPFTLSAGGPELPAKSVDEPLRSVLTRDHQGVVSPFMVRLKNNQGAIDIDEPVVALAEPLTVSIERPLTNRSPARSVNEPIPTITGTPRVGLAEPFVLNMQGDHPQNTDIKEPIPTLLTGNHKYVVEPLVLGQQSNNTAKPVSEPLPTVLTAGKIGLIESQAFIVKYYGSGENTDSTDEPLPTVTTNDRFGLVEPDIVDARAPGSYMPHPGEMGLYLPSLGIVVFIRFRMLQPHELAAAMSFPPDYEFTGNREAKVKQIGNAVPLKTAKALCKALLA